MEDVKVWKACFVYFHFKRKLKPTSVCLLTPHSCLSGSKLTILVPLAAVRKIKLGFVGGFDIGV